MTVNNNVTRIASEADLNDTNKYALLRASTERIAMVDDPVRGRVVRVVRDTNDALVNGSHRTEIVRDKFVSEYNFGTGGGYYWCSYELDPEWLAKYKLLEASVPASVDYSINIMQFHPRNTDGTVHPKWTIAINEFGVCLRKWAQSDAAAKYEIVAIWPVDSMVWHDIVCYVNWSTGNDGVFALYLDDQLIYRHLGPTIYPGATAGCWWAQGIYAPGGFPAGITQLAVYCQGLRQVYPDGTFEDCRGIPAKAARQVNQVMATVPASTIT